jgi:hypothetical protein|nr:MAG TPA: hypothetical protein [Caudoviricetes sp.]
MNADKEKTADASAISGKGEVMVFRSNFNPIITRMIGERQCLHQKK